MGVQVAFDFNAFTAAFPEFAYAGPTVVQNYWTMATTLHRNDGIGPVTLATTQALLLNTLTAHLLKLFAPTATGQAAPDLVGRISNASEGSVSVGTEYPGGTQSSAWYIQTKYGAMYWAMTKPYRTFRYKRGRTRNMNPFPIA